MKMFVNKRGLIWLFVVMLIFSSLGGLGSGQTVVFAEEKEQDESSDESQRIMAEYPFNLDLLNSNQQQQAQQPLPQPQDQLEVPATTTQPADTEVGDLPSNTPAPQPTATQAMPSLTDWMLDEEAGKIYVLLSASNELVVLNKQSLAIEQRLFVGSMPSDMDRSGDTLYITLSGSTMIQTVDLKTMTLGETFNVGIQARNLCVTPTHVFYTENGSSWSEIYSFNLSTKTTQTLKNKNSYFTMYKPVLHAAGDDRTIFIGETNLSGSDLVAYDYIANEIVGDSNYDAGYGFPYPSEKIVVDSQSVYFGGYRMNKTNVAEFMGQYARFGNYSYLNSKVYDVSDQYVLTLQGIYDKNTYLKLANLPFEADRGLIDEEGNVFLYSYSNVSSYSLPLETPSPVQIEVNNQQSINSNYPITDWITDSNTPYIYIISELANELTILRKSDFSLVKSIWIGSRPVDIDMDSGTVYIGFKGETHTIQFAVSNTEKEDMEITKRTVKDFPIHIYPYHNKIFYHGMGSDSIVVLNENNETLGINRSSWYQEYFLDKNEGMLYISGSFELYKIDANTLNMVKSGNSSLGSNSTIYKDGEFLYIGSKRVNSTDLSTIYGTYPEEIIYAKDNLVFGRYGIYDRDTFKRIVDLPFPISTAQVQEDQSILLSSGNKIYKFSSLDEFKPVIKANFLPTNQMLLDINEMENKINGLLLFTPPGDQNNVRSYTFYLLDKDGNKVQQVYPQFNQTMEDGTIVFNVDISLVPQNAVAFGIYIYLNQEHREYSEPTISTLWDMPTYLPTNFEFNDTNRDAKVFSGTITWEPGSKEPQDAEYHLYFIDPDGRIGEALHSVDVGAETYSATLNDVDVPDEAVGMGLFLQKKNGETPPFYSITVFPGAITPALSVETITIVNNQSDMDRVTVRNVQTGDIIRVYDGEGTILGKGTVPANLTHISLFVPNIGQPGQRIIVTREIPGKFESDGVLVTVPNVEVITPTPPPVVDPPPVVSPPPVVGPSPPVVLPPPVIGPPGPNPKLDEKVVDRGGKKFAVGELSEKYADYLMRQEEFLKNKTLTLQTEKSEGNVQYKLSEKVVKFVVNNHPGATIEVLSAAGSLRMDAITLEKELAARVGDQTIILWMEQAGEEYGQKLASQMQGAQALGKPVEFKVLLSDGVTEIELNKFSQYVEHKLAIKTGQVPASELVGLTYDPASQAYVPVPAKFVWKDGVLTVSLYRKGNSVYTVVRNNFSFSDLPNVGEYQTSIQTLANRMIISGYGDGTFGPDQTVTRAQFAKMLIRSLGIIPKATTTSRFKDVKAGQWYIGDVEAAVEAGLFKGYEDGTFRPNSTITNAQMLVMLKNALTYLGVQEDSTEILPDSLDAVMANLPDWEKENYLEVYRHGILKDGQDLFIYKSNKATTRKDSALLLYRLLGLL
jgi:hypothetical protein